jgi:ubiquitin-activating enzyme E1
MIITEPRSIADFIYFDEICRKLRVSFLCGITCGVSSTIFVDHGDDHFVNDPNGEKPVQKLITEITKLSNTELLIRYDHPAGQLPEAISAGHYEVTDIVGMTPLNHQTYAVKRESSDPVKTVRLQFSDTSILDSYPYISGGLLTEKKIPMVHPMKSFAEKLKSPGNVFAEPPTLVLTDLLNFGSELQLHVSFLSYLKFIETNEKKIYPESTPLSSKNIYSFTPKPHDESDIKAMVDLANSLLADKTVEIEDFELDTNFITRYATYAGIELQPMAAFVGGILAQEVVKCTGHLL